MIPWFLLLTPLSAVTAVDKTFGIAPDNLSKYTPTASGTWSCLDGSLEIPWTAINNDYCDCPDGSDEPGTGACAAGTFYCHNTGHIGAHIPSSRVNDGLCEPECCDGSDESSGVCPNICEAVGKAYRAKRDAENKIRKTGAKIRSTYIIFAQKEKKRLEALIMTSAEDVSVKEADVSRLQDVADRTESLSAAALAHKQKSPLYKSLVSHSSALVALRERHNKLKERETQLGEVLSALRAGYNPNYQDMAVLEAVRGWEELAGLPHIGTTEADASESEAESVEGTDSESTVSEEAAAEPEDEWTDEKMDQLKNTDLVSLLLEHDEHTRSPDDSESMLFEISSYLPDSFIPTYEEWKETLVGFLQTIRIIRRSDTGAADSTAARAALSAAESTLSKARTTHKDAVADLQELFDPEGFGSQGEWKKLDGTCLDLNTGDYTYEVCMFGEAKQKPNNGGQTFTLGKFHSWHPSRDVPIGTPEFYSRQVYNKGTRCWNGPERSVILVMTCGTENAITSVAELEKCEYQFTGTTPALCLPLEIANGDVKREEL